VVDGVKSGRQAGFYREKFLATPLADSARMNVRTAYCVVREVVEYKLCFCRHSATYKRQIELQSNLER